MLKANQQFVLQSANQQLLAIRQNEIDYYSNYFGTFGFISALLVGFTISSLTQVLSMTANVPRLVKSWYWISCTFTIACGIHCVVTTAVISVFGLGLSINGPLGSMVRSIRGMIQEETAIFNSFILTVIAFGTLLL